MLDGLSLGKTVAAAAPPDVLLAIAGSTGAAICITRGYDSLMTANSVYITLTVKDWSFFWLIRNLQNLKKALKVKRANFTAGRFHRQHEQDRLHCCEVSYKLFCLQRPGVNMKSDLIVLH